jgi:hypothetical protein
MLVIFAGALLAAGRVWRFPFDDEVYAMVPAVAGISHASTWDLVQFYLGGGDIHPPLTFLFFATLHEAGVSEAALHLISAVMTALSLVLWQLLAMATSPRPAGVVSRLIAVLLFGLCPMAIGLGDAIRWYPQFTLCVAVFAALYLAGATAKARLASAIPLGLAASINLIAPLVMLPFAIHRYGLERRWRMTWDGAFWAIFALFAAPGLWSAVFIAPASTQDPSALSIRRHPAPRGCGQPAWLFRRQCGRCWPRLGSYSRGSCGGDCRGRAGGYASSRQADAFVFAAVGVDAGRRARRFQRVPIISVPRAGDGGGFHGLSKPARGCGQRGLAGRDKHGCRAAGTGRDR